MSKSRVGIFTPAALVIGGLALILSGTAQAQSIAQMLTPPPGSTLTSASVTFTWSAGTDVLQYYLYVGSVLGGNDVYGASQGSSLTGMVTNLPTDGRILYVRLWSFVNANTDVAAGWQSIDYQYLAFNANTNCGALSKAAMTSPVSGSILTGASVTFQWLGNLCDTQFTLAVGTTGAGSSDIFGPTVLTSQSQLVNGLPTDGITTVYVRLTSTIGGLNFFNDYTYTAFNATSGCAPPAGATITAPTPGSTLTGASQTFTWSAGCGVVQYYLYVGSTFAGNDVYGQNQGTSLSGTVGNLPVDGRTLYVRIWSFFGGIWHFNDYTFTASGTGSGCNSLPAQITLPAPGSTLTGSSATFTWTAGSCVTQYTLSVGNEQGGAELYGPVSFGTGTLTQTVNSLPTDGRALFVRLSSTIAGNVTNQDYQYVAFANANGCGTPSGASMTSPVPSSALTGPSVTFSWTAGCNVSEYFLWVGTAAGGSDLYSLDQGTRMTAVVNNLPTNGQALFVRLWSLYNGSWHFNDYTYTASGSSGCTTPAAATMISPVSGTTLTGSSVTFTWTPGSCVTLYTLSVGTTAAGSSDVYGPTTTVNQSLTVSNLPTAGQTVFVRLTSTVNGANQSTDYTYTAFSSATGCTTSSLATMATPVPGSTLTSGTVTFTWNAGCNASQYFLYVGSSMGGNDLYGMSQGSGLTATVAGLPTNGQIVFVRLWTYISIQSATLSIGWSFIDYTYTSGAGGGGGCNVPTAATIATPAPGSTLAGASVTFTASAGSCVSTYTLAVGSSVGASDIFLSATGAAMAWTVNSLPTNGQTVFVRVTSQFSTGGSQNVDLTYTASTGAGGGCAGSGLAAIATPAPGSTLPGSTTTFTWTAGCNALQYFLFVGTNFGGNNVYSSSEGINLSATVTTLPVTGATMYVRLWTYLTAAVGNLNAGWNFVDYTYTSF